MIQGKWFAPGEPLAKDLLSVQEKVFGVSGKAHDPEGWNTLVFMDEEPAASGRIWWQDGSFWLGNIGVLVSCRGHRHSTSAPSSVTSTSTSHWAEGLPSLV